MIEKVFNELIDILSIDNFSITSLQKIIDFLSERPKVFYRKFRKGKKIYKTRKMFCYNPMKELLTIPTVLFCMRQIRRRLNNEENIKF